MSEVGVWETTIGQALTHTGQVMIKITQGYD